ncbi:MULTISPECIES: dihydrodipicolinate synthase family protein [unclassified Paenibacillus]|uniref:dihydrodipicolinate synthase family protein n=1 Tax=unclassified Paenibacillus TaxID=185978 RepID=UPI0024053C76|nr:MULTISPECIES: dihydrodipicolinate synthase family protein [unclassified Paenibacillus]MDF9843713.1 4-hydroxy-tetrahydrodipicolinate synthase [Paenibacillus sp. PastF-2]MDF9850302.1 4-hydroxy-tetrahydrodipicolinate synthase [Paenibacillus sp. PastM-2]MDF9856758.1 4-hydroxy-tetrahydrodipicolinate synthase [Paenibacillus sp. PastF-1]MDH6482148.1 4-hydroxy-tetrahydrodipicolinate synthase [Paenibacillus sp. PastH-2]MDH6509569.1 4-hydroxy-tetrahydrodipicolinate synthase [Paenibacillus sp. PastM-3
MFQGLSAFPLTPLDETGINEKEFIPLIERLGSAGVDSVGVLGSTGNYAYLTRAQREQVLRLAVQAAGRTPVMTSISALRTLDVLHLAEDAQQAGASAVLLSPVSYQPLTDEEVFHLYEQVTSNLSVPLCVYDNPNTTHFRFSDELHGRIANLPIVAAIKIPGVPSGQEAAGLRIRNLRELVPSRVVLGISGDPSAAAGLRAGCEVWFSVLGGLLPKTCLQMTRLAQAGREEEAEKISILLEPLWALFRQYGSLRVASAIAQQLGFISEPALPLPLLPLNSSVNEQLTAVLREITVLEEN